MHKKVMRLDNATAFHLKLHLGKVANISVHIRFLKTETVTG